MAKVAAQPEEQRVHTYGAIEERKPHPMRAMLHAIFIAPFEASADDVLRLPRRLLDRRRRSGLLRLILVSITLLQLPVIAAFHFLVVNGDQFAIALGVNTLLAIIALVINRMNRVYTAGLLFCAGGVLLSLPFTLGNPHGLDDQSLLIYALFALIPVIAGLILPSWLMALITIGIVLLTGVGILVTGRPPNLPTSRDLDFATFQFASFALLAANQSCAGIISWLYGRSADAGINAAVAAYERERELAALKDQFIIDANHELRTPIMALYGNVELLVAMNERVTSEQRLRLLKRAMNSGESVLRLLSSVLDSSVMTSKAPEVRVKQVRLGPLVNAVLETFDPREIGEPGIEASAYASRAVTVNIPPDLVIWADEGRLRQILVNLLSNALKYSEPGTPIDITAKALSASALARTLRFAASIGASTEDAAFAQITVRDYGLGVPARDAPKLFNRFVRLERDIAGPVRGTGVGLYLCRLLIEAMGGRIWVESIGIPGEGSAFSFTLPVSESMRSLQNDGTMASAAPHAPATAQIGSGPLPEIPRG